MKDFYRDHCHASLPDFPHLKFMVTAPEDKVGSAIQQRATGKCHDYDGPAEPSVECVVYVSLGDSWKHYPEVSLGEES